MSDDNLKVVTPVARLSFPSLFQPSKPQGAPAEQQPKYGCTLLFEKGEDLTALKKAVKEAIEIGVREKWGGKKPEALRMPFHNQGEKDYDGYEDGAIFITMNSKQRPGIIDGRKNRIENEEDIYPGCYVRASVRAFPYGGKGTSFSPGISFGLQNIQKVRDGEQLGGRMKPEDEFEAIESEGGGDDLNDLLDMDD
jgi:hypothetical protein